jgi:hypothetical protein
MEKYVLKTISNYSTDYPTLIKNWDFLCEKFSTRKKEILLVKDIDFKQSDSEMMKVFDIATKDGYCIRRVDEFTTCRTCGNAIPCKELWTLLHSKNIPVPDVWSEKCSTC